MARGKAILAFLPSGGKLLVLMAGGDFSNNVRTEGEWQSMQRPLNSFTGFCLRNPGSKTGSNSFSLSKLMTELLSDHDSLPRYNLLLRLDFLVLGESSSLNLLSDFSTIGLGGSDRNSGVFLPLEESYPHLATVYVPRLKGVSSSSLVGLGASSASAAAWVCNLRFVCRITLSLSSSLALLRQKFVRLDSCADLTWCRRSSSFSIGEFVRRASRSSLMAWWALSLMSSGMAFFSGSGFCCAFSQAARSFPVPLVLDARAILLRLSLSLTICSMVASPTLPASISGKLMISPFSNAISSRSSGRIMPSSMLKRSSYEVRGSSAHAVYMVTTSLGRCWAVTGNSCLNRPFACMIRTIPVGMSWNRNRQSGTTA
jgi:hypothetical protein